MLKIIIIIIKWKDASIKQIYMQNRREDIEECEYKSQKLTF